MKQFTARFRASLLALSLLLSLAACSGRLTAASTMHLRRAEGTVSVSNADGKSLPVLDNLGLYSGYGVSTGLASYAWIDLDAVKLTKLDQNSEISIEKEGKDLNIELKSGSLFFNVAEPLEDDETMNIHTSTMLVGIRGTCGWVEEREGLSRTYILEGKVECAAEGQTVRVSAGEFAELRPDGELMVQEFTDEDVPAFVRDEADPDLFGADETPAPDGSEAPTVSVPPAPTPTPTPAAERELVASGEAGENLTWTYYSDGTLTVSGTGNMSDYSYEGAPWFRYHAQIRTVMIDGGVTGIGAYAFESCGGLASVTIPSRVASIGQWAFDGCDSLTDIYYGGSEEQWNRISGVESANIPTDTIIHYNNTGIAAGTSWNGHTYLVYDVSMTWEEAMTYCKNLGGHLVTITSREEQAVINDLLGNQCSKNGYWLGGIRLSSSFVWITGEQMSYTNWDSRQPDNANNAEDKMMLYNYSDARLGTWNDLSSEGMDDVIVAHGDMGFICEWDTDETYPGDGPDIQQTFWQGHRYQVFNNVTTWQDAELYCELLGGHLATISCQEENDFIYRLMIEAGYTSAYFGLTDRDEEGTWIWITGEPVTYTNWHEGEPNSAHPNENYGMFYSSFGDGTWNDGDFEWGGTGGGTAFICEWEPMNALPS